MDNNDDIMIYNGLNLKFSLYKNMSVYLHEHEHVCEVTPLLQVVHDNLPLLISFLHHIFPLLLAGLDPVVGVHRDRTG